MFNEKKLKHLKIRVFVLAVINVFVLFAADQTLAANYCSQSTKARWIKVVRQHNPSAYKVYKQRPRDFMSSRWWSGCSRDPIQSVGTAVHEVIHAIDSAGLGGYQLVSGKKLPYISNSGLMKPARIRNKFAHMSSGDILVDTYLTIKPGEMNSSNAFNVFLDEFNAYTHDMNTALKLAHLDKNHHIHEGGYAFMAFLKEYLQKTKTVKPNAWRTLSYGKHRKVIAALWRQAEVLGVKLCNKHARRLGHVKAYVSEICNSSTNAGISQILGRAPQCPRSCLTGKPTPIIHTAGNSGARNPLLRSEVSIYPGYKSSGGHNHGHSVPRSFFDNFDSVVVPDTDITISN